MSPSTANLRINELKPLISPALLLEKLPLNTAITDLITDVRQQIANIIHSKDDRLLVVLGPCSIHDPIAALEYAKLLKIYAKQLNSDLCIIMRVYFEKPRTTVGWKGLINDPNLDGSFTINQGLHVARKLLLDINSLGVAAGTEFLDTIIPQFIGDLIVWGAIGARTTESQIHRELTSGLSMPIGFKNGTTGNIQIAVDAIRTAQNSHHFLGVTQEGLAAIVCTKGNQDCHVILRGSSQQPNYSQASINEVINLLAKNQLSQRLMVDCSHGNSEKDYNRQPIVAQALCRQISAGSSAICGVMLESNLKAGRQDMQPHQPLTYGQSVTDACISWEQTIPVLESFAEAVRARRRIK